MSLYQDLLKAGCEIDSHESDLYVKATPEALRIVRDSKVVYEGFRSAIDGTLWLDIFAAYDPFWQKRA